MIKHEQLKKSFDKILRLPKWIEVLSDRGWCELSYICISNDREVFEIETDDGKKLGCTEDHIIFNDRNQLYFGGIDNEKDELYAHESVGRQIITRDSCKFSTVKSITKKDKKETVYDLSLGDNTCHRYYTNGILSENCIICDEYAFLPPAISEKLFTSLYPVISASKDGKMIIISTPNGQNHFYDIWLQAHAGSLDMGFDTSGIKNDGNWKAFRMDWWDVPNRDEKFKQATIASIGIDRWNQEFGCEFTSSANSKKLVPQDKTDQLKRRIEAYKQCGFNVEGFDIPIRIQETNKTYNVKTWYKYEPTRTYVAGGDIAEGIGSDYSVIYIFDVTDLSNIKQVAKFSSNIISIHEFAYLANELLMAYNNPVFIAETNGCGKAFIDLLKQQYDYPNLVREAKTGYGVMSIGAIKGIACMWMRDMFINENFDFEIYDKALVAEMNNFAKVVKNQSEYGTYRAIGGHDDLVMSFLWLCYLLRPNIVEKYYSVDEYNTSSYGAMIPMKLSNLYSHDKQNVDFTKLRIYRETKSYVETNWKMYEKMHSVCANIFKPKEVGESIKRIDKQNTNNIQSNSSTNFLGNGRSSFFILKDEGFDDFGGDDCW